jgi:gluconolactonase
VVVAHPTVGAVWVFSRIGEPLYYLKSCAREMTTNVAYGGPDNRTLYITESRSCSILTARLPVPGKTMFSHADD